MFDKYMICTSGLRNVTEHGTARGFAFDARLPYYRGLGLSMVEDLHVTVDGRAIDRAAISLALRGRSWTLDEMETEYTERWNFGEVGEIFVSLPGGLTPGPHEIRLTERRRVSYLPFLPTTSDSKTLVLEG